MRRAFQGMLCIGLLSMLSATVGCNLMTGVCDCEPHGCPAGITGGCGGSGCGNVSAAPLVPTPMPAPRIESVREMPRALDK